MLSLLRKYTAAAALFIGVTAPNAHPAPQDTGKDPRESAYEGRIVTPEEIERATRPPALAPLRILSFPHRAFTSGMENGLISFEKNRMRQKLGLWTEKLRSKGVEPLLGGLGEGTGFGGGGTYTLKAGGSAELVFLGRATFKSYQEFDVLWTTPDSRSRLTLEASYQWRPEENFYGLGQGSRKDQRTNFALRQTWTGARWEIRPLKGIRFGAEYRHAWLLAGAGRNPLFSAPDEIFPDLQGYGTQIRLHNTGAYLNLSGFRGEYGLGGLLHLGASFQSGREKDALRYFTYEIQGEGRLPVAKGRSVIVGQVSAEFNRERSGSAPIPFFLLPHVGGSSTLRGFALDRFYGKNILLATLEYRYRIHPNIQTVIFFDEGQMYDRTRELSWLNWQRNYGFGFRMLSVRGTQLRLEFGSSSEGLTWHISFGDRERRPLGGPVRYGTYRR